MKKKLSILFSLIFVCLLSISPVQAKNNVLNSVHISAFINNDGSAHIQEVWDIDVYKGTEIYKVFDNMNESQISDLKVRDGQGNQYENIGEWDTDASKEEKDGKSGLVTKENGYELCFGIGEYGHNEYVFEYKVSDFVKQYTNDQGINYAFFSEMSLEPHQVEIVLTSAHQFNQDNSRIWAFGYHGDVVFKDGKVVMTSNETVPENGKMQLLMRMNDGTFETAYPTGKDFDSILDEAQNGSSYQETPKVFIVICVILGAVFMAIIGAIIYQLSSRKHFVFKDHISLKEEKEINMFRDIPCQKNIYLFHYLSMKLNIVGQDQKSSLIAAVLLKWIQKGYIEFEKREEKKLGIFKKDGFSIQFNKNFIFDYQFEEDLLKFFKQAAGANGLLETKEFEKWCGDHYEDIDEWFERIDSDITNELQNKNLLTLEKTYSKVIGLKIPQTSDCYDSSIRDEMEHILGLRKFLKEMSLIDEKEVIEVKMWEEYLIYASILGIADKVQEQLGRLCPTFNQQSELDTIYTMQMVHMFAYNSMQASYHASQAASTAGLGGGASFGGGGGGFSGGGGGGVR